MRGIYLVRTHYEGVRTHYEGVRTHYEGYISDKDSL